MLVSSSYGRVLEGNGMEQPPSNGAGDSNAYNVDLPDAVPERWETAIEDFVQLLALAIDRAQDLADVVNDLLRGHPELVRAGLAAAAGGIVGAILAGRMGRKPEPVQELKETIRERTRRSAASAAERGGALLGTSGSLLGGAASTLRGSAEQWVRRAPAPEEIREQARRRMPRLDSIGLPIAGRGSDGRASNVGHAVQLVPIAIALMKNPIVRDFVIRSAMKAARSRYR